MLYAFTGTDTLRTRKEVRDLVDRLSRADPMARVIRFDDQSFDVKSCLEALNEQNIFGGQNIVILDGVLENGSGEAFYRDDLKDFPNILIVREVSPKKAILSSISTLGTHTQFDEIKAAQAKRFGDFALADAVAIRDKKNAWVEFEKSRRGGEAMEAVHGMLFWVFKTLATIASVPKAEAIASGVKAFTYGKYQEGLKSYKVEEVLVRLDTLKDIYHRAHRGEIDMEIALEQFIIKL